MELLLIILSVITMGLCTHMGGGDMFDFDEFSVPLTRNVRRKTHSKEDDENQELNPSMKKKLFNEYHVTRMSEPSLILVCLAIQQQWGRDKPTEPFFKRACNFALNRLMITEESHKAKDDKDIGYRMFESAENENYDDSSVITRGLPKLGGAKGGAKGGAGGGLGASLGGGAGGGLGGDPGDGAGDVPGEEFWDKLQKQDFFQTTGGKKGKSPRKSSGVDPSSGWLGAMQKGDGGDMESMFSGGSADFGGMKMRALGSGPSQRSPEGVYASLNPRALTIVGKTKNDYLLN